MTLKLLSMIPAAAVSDREATLALSERGTRSAIVAGQVEGVATSSVQAIRLDDFVFRHGNHPPDFIKLDVEGHGGAAIAGGFEVFRARRCRLLCEIHHEAELEAVTAPLGALGYRLTAVGRGRRNPRHIVLTPPPG